MSFTLPVCSSATLTSVRRGVLATVAACMALNIDVNLVAADAENPAQISIDTTQRAPVRLRFGYGEYVINARPYHRFNEPAYVAAIKDSGASVLRFPGGTMGNFYDWKNDDFMPDTIRSLSPAALVPRDRFPTAEAYQATLKKFQGYLHEWGGKADADREIRGRYGYDDFADLARQSSADISYVGNISVAPAGRDPGDYLVEWMAALKSRGVTVKYLELGNEINGPKGASNTQAILNGLYSLDRYMAVAEKTSRRIKAIFPAIKIGILSDDAGNKIGPACNSIDLSARQIMAKYPTDFYDAVVIHPYLRCQDKSTDERPEIRKDRLFATSQQVAANTVAWVKSVFPGKEIWITETGYIAGTLHDENTLTGRMVTGLLEADYFLRYAEHDDIVRAYIKFFAIASNPPTDSSSDGDHPAVKSAMYWDSSANRVIKSPVYYAYALAAGAVRGSKFRLTAIVGNGGGIPFTIPNWVPALDGSGRRIPGKGQTEPATVQVEYLTAHAFLAVDGRTIRIVVLNKGASPRLLALVVDGKPVTRGTLHVTTVAGDLLGQNTREQPDRIAPATSKSDAGDPLKVPGYSVNVIAVDSNSL